MVTKMLGVKDFRQNMARYAVSARRHGWRYVVLSRNEPIFEVIPLSKKDAVVDKLAEEIAEARADVKAGRVRPMEEVFKSLGL